MAPYDVIGNVVIVKFNRHAKKLEKKRWASRFLKEHKQVTTVLEKIGKVKGRLRTGKTKYVAGVKTREALYRENGCEFRLNVDSCYFSPRLASERKEIAEMTKKGERVLVMFGGVGVYAIVIAKMSKAREVVSVELGRECSKYALENVRRNKLNNVRVVQGDVRKVCKKMGKFDRVVMPRPNLKDSFLDVAFENIKRGGVVYYYGFYDEDRLEEMKEMIFKEAGKIAKRVKILGVKKAGDIGKGKYRYRADIKVLN